MAVLLLPLVFFFLFRLSLRWGMGRREAFLLAAVWFGGLTVVSVEGLSLGRALALGPLSGFWLIVAVITGWWSRKTLWPSWRLESRWWWIVGLWIGLIALTGWWAPPNNYDSLTYHLGRVMHWMQQGSVAHYPTHIIRQLYMTPYANYEILQTIVLSGADTWAFVVQWRSMIVSVIGVSLVVELLGGSRRAGVIGAVLVATLPLGILQSSSTQTDYVVTGWLIILIYGLGKIVRDGIQWVWVFASSLALGLAMLTKGLAFPYAFPFCAAFGVLLLIRQRQAAVPVGLTIMVLAAGLNLGFWWRNQVTFQSPLGLGSSDTESLATDHPNVQALVSNVLKNAALHSPNWIPLASKWTRKTVIGIHSVLGWKLNDWNSAKDDFHLPWLFRHEDMTGNTLHAGLVLFTLLMLMGSPALRRSRPMGGYAGCWLVAALLFCLLIKWTIVNTRYHVGLFVLAMPLVALVLENLSRPRLVQGILVVVVLASLPQLLANQTRPLWDPFQQPASIFVGGRAYWQFRANPKVAEDYEKTLAWLRGRPIRNLGLLCSNDDPEYPLWSLWRGVGQRDIRIEHVGVTNRSVRYAVEPVYLNFYPEVIVAMDKEIEGVGAETGQYDLLFWSGSFRVYHRKLGFSPSE